MGPRPKLYLYTDVISPFAYIAFHVATVSFVTETCPPLNPKLTPLETSPIFNGCDVEIIPVFLGGIMEATGNRPPLVIKNKGNYLGFERVHWAKQFNLEFADRNPEPFPQNTVHAMRAVCAVQSLKPEKFHAYIAALYRTFFLKLEPISKPEVFGRVLADVLGSEDEAKTILQHSASQQVKDALRKGTEEAIESGAFGLPWYVAENAKGERRGFWGVSHLGMAIDHLGLDRSIEPGLRSML